MYDEPNVVEPDAITLADLQFPKEQKILRRYHRKMIAAGTYEGPEWDALAKIVRPDDHILELGSGIGYLSTASVKRRDAKHVTTYEANPALIPFIKQVHALNGVADRIDVRNALVSIDDGPPVPFYVRGNFEASSMSNNLGDRFGGVIEVAEVEQHKMSTVMEEVKPTLFVCDIEGAELALLPHTDFSGVRAAVIEIHPKQTGLSGVKEIFDAFSKQGFAYDADCSSGQTVTFQRV